MARAWSVAAVVAAVVVGLSGRHAVSAQGICDVTDNAEIAQQFDDFSEAPLKTVQLAELLPSNELLVLPADSQGGFPSQVWVTEQERLSDGFVAEFEFTATGWVDGVAFVVQNDKLVNTAGGIKERLGFASSLEKFMGVGFETCKNFTQDDCDGGRVTIWYHDGSGEVLAASNALPTSQRDMGDGNRTLAEVQYLAQSGVVVVKVDGVEIVRGNVGVLEEILDSRFAYYGFSASSSEGVPTGNGDDITGSVVVHDLTLSRLPSDTAIISELEETVTWGRTYTFTLAKRDSCLEVVPFTDSNMTVWANLTNLDSLVAQNLTDERDFVLGVNYYNPTRVEETEDGTIEIDFDIPSRIAATWRLSVEVNGVAAQGMPLDGAIISEEPPPPSGLPLWGLILLIVIIVLIVLGLIYAIVRLRRYRKKLRENEENIEAGKEKAKIDIMDRDVQYSVNPMLGSLDDMKRKLKENERELERLRTGKSSLYDDAYTIDQLQAQNKELRDEMIRLKRQAQEEAAMADSSVPVVETERRERKQFGQERA